MTNDKYLLILKEKHKNAKEINYNNIEFNASKNTL